jgi:hypothetical protein
MTRLRAAIQRYHNRRWARQVRADQIAGCRPAGPSAAAIGLTTVDHLGRIRRMCGRLQPLAGALGPHGAPTGHHDDHPDSAGFETALPGVPPASPR